MADRFGAEISDLIVDYDPTTLARRPVRKADVVEALANEGRGWPLRIARSLSGPDGLLDDDEVDGILVRSHLELQRLHEEFRVGETMRLLLAPMLELVRAQTTERPIRIVDVGCGLGYVVRWLAVCGRLGADVAFEGADYNAALVHAANLLAAEEELDCRFLVANAFGLDAPAHVFLSTGVLHHFRGDALANFFRRHQTSPALGFVHVDIRPSLVAPLGSLLFHVSRMREPLAQYDGYWSAVRAHRADTVSDAVRQGAPGFFTGTFDARPGLSGLLRIFQAFVGVRCELEPHLRRAYAPWSHRLRYEP